MRKASFILSISLSMVAITAMCQTTIHNEKISLSFENILLKDLITVLQKTHQLNISYSIDYTPVNRQLSISANDLPLSLFLEILCNKTGLTYQIINKHIVLREQVKAKSPRIKIPQDPPITNKYFQNDSDSTTAGYRLLKPVEELKQLPRLNNFLKVPVLEVAENLLDHATLVSTQTRHSNLPLRRKRVKRKPAFGIGISASFDHLIMHFEDRPNNDQQYFPELNFSAGLGTILGPGEKMSVSLNVLLSSRNYFLNYNYKVIDPEDPFPFPDKTTVGLFLLEFPMNLNYRFYSKEKFSLYFSAGLMMEFLIRQKEHTTFLNSADKETTLFINDHNKFLYGGSLGVKFWYDLDRSFSVFIKPVLRAYFTSINDVITRSNPQILKLNAGLILRIHPVKLF